jgi:hypothetical protein
MLKKHSFIAATLVVFTFASAARSNAGVDMIDNSGAPAPTYNYVAPAPPVVRYVYPRVRVVVAPCPPPVAVFGYRYAVIRRPHCRPRRLR